MTKIIDNDPSERDPLFNDVARTVVTSGDATATRIQFDYNIGWNRAFRILKQLEVANIVGARKLRQPRKVLVDLNALEHILTIKNEITTENNNL